MREMDGRAESVVRPRGSATCATSSVRVRQAVLTCLLVPLMGLFSSARAEERCRLAFVQVPKAAGDSAGGDVGVSILSGRYRLGMRIAVADFDDVAGTVRPIAKDFACSTDPVFSHDGGRLAFAGKRSAEGRLQVWELVGDEVEPRQLFTCDADCVQPVYMPDGHIVFASFLAHEYEEHGGLYSSSIYEWSPGAESPTRLTFNPSSDFDPVVLPDGRILYSSWQHVGNHHWPRGVVALMLVNSDGTGIFPLTGNHRGPWLKRGARPFGVDRVAFIQSDGSGDFGAGALVATSLNDAFAPYAALVSSDEYEVAGVAPLADGKLVLSARPTDGSRSTFGLYVLQGGVVRLLYDDPNVHELAPAVGAVQRKPEIRFSTVVPGTPYGYLLVLNCYDTDRTDQHALPKGSVSMVRVIEGMPVRHDGGRGPEFFSVAGREDEPLIRPNSATGYIPARILGEVPPAPDGSIYLKVPADRPLRMQLIDREGFAIVNERAWFWVRPNERRVCIGCHENRELSAENATPLAVARVPTDLTDPSGWRTVSFRKNIQPILTANCAVSGCHIPPTPPAGLNQTAGWLNGHQDAVLADRFGPAYANHLARQKNKPFSVGGRRVHPGDARRSPLLWMLYGRALGPQYQPAPFDTPMMSPHPGPMLPETQLELIRQWVDLGAQYDDESPPGPWPYGTSAARVTEATR